MSKINVQLSVIAHESISVKELELVASAEDDKKKLQKLRKQLKEENDAKRDRKNGGCE